MVLKKMSFSPCGTGIQTPGVTDKLGLAVQNDACKRLTEFRQENTQLIANTLSNNTREDFTHGHHQMVNIEVGFIIILAAKVGEAL